VSMFNKCLTRSRCSRSSHKLTDGKQVVRTEVFKKGFLLSIFTLLLNILPTLYRPQVKVVETYGVAHFYCCKLLL